MPSASKIKKWAVFGDPIAQHQLARLEMKKRRPNCKEALNLLKASATTGYAIAQFDLGLCYLEGICVPKNRKLGITWLKRAAFQSIAEAQAKLSECYQLGTGCMRDETLAGFWLYASATNGFKAAQKQLAEAYSNGTMNFKKSQKESLKWLKQSQSRGSTKRIISRKIMREK